MKTWAETITELLREKRISTYELQKKHGISNPKISNIMRGLHNPSMKTIRDLERVLHVRFDFDQIIWLERKNCIYQQEKISHLPTSNTQQTPAGSGMPACQRDYLTKQSEDSYGSRSN